MVRVLEPLLSQLAQSDPATGVLTAVDVDLDLERSRTAALIMAVTISRDGSVIVDANDWTWALIGRPDYAVQTVGNGHEPFEDVDFIAGESHRYDVLTSGTVLTPLSNTLEVPGGGYLVTRRMSALFFTDVDIDMFLRVWYKMVLLSDAEIADFFFLRR